METQKDFLVEKAKRFIRSKGTIIYLNHTVTSDSGLQAAAEFLTNELITFSSFVEHDQEPNPFNPEEVICYHCYFDHNTKVFNINGICDVCYGQTFIAESEIRNGE